MGFSKSALAYDDVREVFDKAMGTENGLRLRFTSHGRAVSARQRFHSFRVTDRRENRKIYGEDHPMWGKSVFDKLVLRIPPKGAPDENYLYLEKRSAALFEIEELGEPSSPPERLQSSVPTIELDIADEKS